MKKIFALLLIAVLALSLFVSCGDDPAPTPDGGATEDNRTDVEKVAAMYANSQPTKVVATTTQTFGNKTLTGSYTLTVGTVDGVEAANYVAEYEQMRDVNSGATINIYGPIEAKTEQLDYRKGWGVRSGGFGNKWDKNAESFVPEKGAIALNLVEENLTDVKYENNKLTFKVTKDKTAAVLGEENALNVDVLIEIVNDGASIIGVTISYVLPADSANNVEETVITISAVYTYDLERITIE